jgi:hypothetical protein
MAEKTTLEKVDDFLRAMGATDEILTLYTKIEYDLNIENLFTGHLHCRLNPWEKLFYFMDHPDQFGEWGQQFKEQMQQEDE